MAGEREPSDDADEAGEEPPAPDDEAPAADAEAAGGGEAPHADDSPTDDADEAAGEPSAEEDDPEDPAAGAEGAPDEPDDGASGVEHAELTGDEGDEPAADEGAEPTGDEGEAPAEGADDSTAGDAPADDEDGTAGEDDDSDAGDTWTGGNSLSSLRSGPEEDQEMPLADHIEEMLRRLAVVVAVAGLVTLLVLPFAETIINALWYSILPGVRSEIARPRVYGVLELVLTKIKVASLAGLIVALPIVVYETYAFMRPGLYPHERRYYLAAIPTSLVLAVVGASFSYFVVLPAIFTYFLYYSQDVANIGFALGRTFDLILLLMGYMAVVFQIPLFVMLAMMMRLVSRQWLADRRLLFWGAFLGISFLFSPDPTGMAPILVAATMIVLFEGTLLLAKWTGRG